MYYKKRVLHNMRNFAQLGKIKAFNVESELIEDLLNKNLKNQYIINLKLESFKFSIKKYFENGIINPQIIYNIIKSHFFYNELDVLDKYFEEIKICKMSCNLNQLQLKIADFPFDLINIEQMIMSMNKIDIKLRLKDYCSNLFLNKDDDNQNYLNDIEKDFSQQTILDVKNRIKNLQVTLGLSVIPSLKFLEQSIRTNIETQEQNDETENDQKNSLQRKKSLAKSVNSFLDVNHSMITNKEQTDIQKLILLATKKQYIKNFMKDFQNNRKIEKFRFSMFLSLNQSIEHFQFNLLNGTSPYCLDAIQIIFEKLYLKYQKSQISIILQEFLVYNKIQNPVSKIQKQAQEKIVQIPKIEVNVAIVWEEKSKDLTIEKFFNLLTNQKELQQYIQLFKYFLRVKVNIPNIKKNIYPSIYLKLELINYILALPVLQADFLLRNNIIIIPTKDEKKSEKNKKKESKQQYFNYLEFISSYMNYQLNAAKNVYMKCNFISIRVCINSMIILLFQDDELDSQEDEINKQIRGVQTVIDIMKFYAKIDKKKLTINNLSQKNKNKLHVWDLKKYKGEIKCLYSSFYRDVFDLEVKPETLKKKRRKEFKYSMTNPVEFAKFFMLTKPEKQEFKFSDNIVNSLFNKNWLLEDEQIEQEEEEQTELFYQLQELEFHYNKIFFKIENVEFQNEKQIIQNEQQKQMFEKFKMTNLEKINVDHFCCINGFKLIVSNTLKELFKNMALKIINNISFQTKKKLKKKKKQQDINDEEQEFNIDDEFQFMLRKKIECLREYLVAFTIEKPQLNIYDDDSKTQILLASKNQSFGLFYKKLLPLDYFHDDPKMHIKMFINEMQLFTAPQGIDVKNRAFWLEHSQNNQLDIQSGLINVETDEIKQGILNRILKTDSCLFDYGFFKNPIYHKDFSRQQKDDFIHYPIFWNTEKRITKFSIKVNQIDAYFDNINLSNFFLLTNFFVRIVKREQENFKKKEPAIRDIDYKDMKTIENKLYNEAQKANLKDKNAFKMKSMFIAEVKKFNLTLLTREQIKFLALNLEGLDTEMRFNESKFNETDISIKSFDIFNLLDSNLEEEYFFQVENKDCENYCNFRMQISHFNVDGFYEGNKWRIYQNFEFILKPIQVNFTNEIFQHTYDFIWNSQILNKNQKIRNDELEIFDKAYMFNTKQYIKLVNKNKKQTQKDVLTKQQKHDIKPEYFRRFKFHQMNLKINYASGSALTKLNNFKCTLKPYEFRDRFAPIKDIFDQYFKFIGESIVLSLIKYKFQLKINRKKKEDNKSILE